MSLIAPDPGQGSPSFRRPRSSTSADLLDLVSLEVFLVVSQAPSHSLGCGAEAVTIQFGVVAAAGKIFGGLRARTDFLEQFFG